MVMNVPSAIDFDQDPTQVIDTRDKLVINGYPVLVEVTRRPNHSNEVVSETAGEMRSPIFPPA